MEQVEKEQQQQHPLLRSDTGSSSPYSMNPSVAASLSLPFASLNSSADHRILIGDSYNDDPPLGDCGYTTSRPFVILDVIWSFAFVLVSFFVLLTTIKEKPSTPLRLWIAGYALQCLLHVGFVYLDLQIRNQADLGAAVAHALLPSLAHNCIIKKLESMSTVVSSVWWVFGFYWIVVGGQALIQDSPRLYWLAVVFLSFDVFFIIFCIAMACIVFFAVFCCVPVLATIAYAMTIREGASESDIRTLPKYKYCQAKPSGRCETDKNQEVPSLVDSGSSSSTPALTLHPEDSNCCICLYRYVDGAELCTLPCNHHFHYGCISKWLRINATCPLCKFNILKGEMMV